MFNFLDDPNSKQYKIVVIAARVFLVAFATICLFLNIFFGGNKDNSEESYNRAEAVVRSTDLQQRDLNNDLQKWYVDQNK